MSPQCAAGAQAPRASHPSADRGGLVMTAAVDWDALEYPRATWDFLERDWPLDDDGRRRLNGEAIAESLSALLVRAAFADDHCLSALKTRDLESVADRRLQLLLAARMRLQGEGASPQDDAECDSLVANMIGTFVANGEATWPAEDIDADVRRELRALRRTRGAIPLPDLECWFDAIREHIAWIAGLDSSQGSGGEALDDTLRSIGDALVACGVLERSREVFRSLIAPYRDNPLRAGIGRPSDSPAPSRDDLIDRWVPAGVPILVSAREGVGKSSYLVSVAASFAPGRQFLGLPPVGDHVGGVLFLPFEDRNGVLASLDAWERFHGLSAEHVRVPTSSDLLAGARLHDAGFCADLEALIVSEAFSLVLVDTFAEAMDLQDEINASEVTAKMRPLKQLIERTGCSVLLSHHHAKTGGARGSTAILASVRAEHVLAPLGPRRLSARGGKWNAGLPPRAIALRTVSPDGERGRGVVILDGDDSTKRQSDDDLLLERAQELMDETGAGEFRLIDLEPFAESELGWTRGRNGRVSKLTNGWRDRSLKSHRIAESGRSGWFSLMPTNAARTHAHATPL